MHIMMNVICNECKSTEAFVTLTHNGSTMKCHDCRYGEAWKIVPHPELGVLEWNMERTA